MAAVVATCEDLAHFPHRGVPRYDIRPGLRVTHHKGRTMIAYAVDDEDLQVTIVGVFHGGQDFETRLGLGDDEAQSESAPSQDGPMVRYNGRAETPQWVVAKVRACANADQSGLAAVVTALPTMRDTSLHWQTAKRTSKSSPTTS